MESTKDFFISFNHNDRAWAEWIAWTLEEKGYTTIIQSWDFLPGSNFALEMKKGVASARRMLAVLSPNYLSSKCAQAEWAAAFASDPTGEKGILLPVRVADIALTSLDSPIVPIDLLQKTETECRADLLKGVKRARLKPSNKPAFPGPAKPLFPGSTTPKDRPQDAARFGEELARSLTTGVRVRARRWWFAIVGAPALLIAALLYYANGGDGRSKGAAFRVGGQLALAGEAPASVDPVQLDRDSTILSIDAGRIVDMVQRIRGDGDPAKRIASTDRLVDQLAENLTQQDLAFLQVGYGSTGLALVISKWDGSPASENLADHYWLDLSAGIQPVRALKSARDAFHNVNPTMLADSSGRNMIRRALNSLAPYATGSPELNTLFGGSRSWKEKEEH